MKKVININPPCDTCKNIEIIARCSICGINVLDWVVNDDCQYKTAPYEWQRGESLYIWYCPSCGIQLYDIEPPKLCPNCKKNLGRNNVK